MQALYHEQFGGDLKVDTMPEPIPTDHGVVIDVRACRVCRSDWHGWQGHDPDIKSLPHVPGHELAGVVAEVGKEVHLWRVGDRVTMPFVAGIPVGSGPSRCQHSADLSWAGSFRYDSRLRWVPAIRGASAKHWISVAWTYGHQPSRTGDRLSIDVEPHLLVHVGGCALGSVAVAKRTSCR